MMRMIIVAAGAVLMATPAAAQDPDFARFSAGPVMEIGPVADIDTNVAIPADAVFRVAFDIAEAQPSGVINRAFVSPARLINLHARAGVPAQRTIIALVVHGKAVHDLLRPDAYAARFEGADNVNAAVIAALMAQGVRVIVCGQSAAAYGIIESAEFLPGVEVQWSAMTAHALLQQAGYTVNPF